MKTMSLSEKLTYSTVLILHIQMVLMEVEPVLLLTFAKKKIHVFQ